MELEQIKKTIVWEKVRFERSIDDINNRQVFSLEVSIAKDENYLAAFDFVKATVNNQLGIDCEDLEDKRKRLKNDIQRLEYEKRQVEDELTNAKVFHRKAAGFLEALGLKPAEIFAGNISRDDIPF